MKVVYYNFFIVQIGDDLNYFTHIEDVCQFLALEKKFDMHWVEQSLKIDRFLLVDDCHVKMLHIRCSNNENLTLID